MYLNTIEESKCLLLSIIIKIMTRNTRILGKYLIISIDIHLKIVIYLLHFEKRRRKYSSILLC